MKSVHLIIPDLFLPKDFAAEVCAGLHLPALENLLGRGASTPSTGSGRTDVSVVLLENLLCELFGVSRQADTQHAGAPIAPLSAAFDGLAAGCWLRADPVHLHLQRDQMLMASVRVSNGEAEAMCASLNEHFAGQGMEFFAPHPQRWYVRLNTLPRISATPPAQVIGGDVRKVLPTGEDSQHWHRIFNEIQMLLFAHPFNDAREARGELTANTLWFWGGGCSENLVMQKHYDEVSSDDVLAEMFATAAGVPFAPWQKLWRNEDCTGKQLLVWIGLRSLHCGDPAAWRTALQDFETSYARPLWLALRSGKIAQLQLDILSGGSIWRVRLTRGDAWAFWRRAKPLVRYSML